MSNRKLCVKVLFFVFYFYICDGARKFHFPPMCDVEKEIHDCSFQFQSPSGNSCVIFGTKACKVYDFTSWNLKSLTRPELEIDSEFNVSILPYAVYVHRIQENNTPLSAINITLTSLNEGIEGFSLVMTKLPYNGFICNENILKCNICRIIDFRKSMVNIRFPFTFYYDCLHYLVQRQWQNVSIKFEVYPLNTVIGYFVYIPSVAEIESKTACEWKPLVMVFQGSLSKNHVYLKFSNSPENFNISFFNVSLVDTLGITAFNKLLPWVTSDMISSEFHAVVTGDYSVSIGIISKDESCLHRKTSYFYVGEKPKDYSLVLFITMFILLAISGSLLIYFSTQWYIKYASPTSRHTLLFVYSHKRLHHEYLVMYGKDLENKYGLKVNLIYERSGNPIKLLEEVCAQSDVIVFVLSSSLRKVLDENNTREIEHHWIDQLKDAKALIEDSYVGRKRICKICFSYSGIEDMPKCLENRGQLFLLPKDLDKFLCFIFKCPFTLYVLSKLFCKSHHKILNPDKNVDNEEELKKKLKFILETGTKYSSVQKLENKNEINQLPESEILIRTEGDKFDTLNERISLSENSSKFSKNENLGLTQLETNVIDPENDDFVRFCVRKLLRSD